MDRIDKINWKKYFSKLMFFASGWLFKAVFTFV